jgi:hypothetical protein
MGTTSSGGTRLTSVVAMAAVLLVAAVGCSSGTDGDASSGDGGSSGAGTPEVPAVRTTEPAATFSEPLTGGGGVVIAAAETPDLAAVGYVETEVVASGTAGAYELVEQPDDGRWTFAPDGTAADYATRVLLRYPADPDAFSGTVVVEWLNVSSGIDANPDWTNLEAEIVRQGHAWVGVSAQTIGVEGGPVLVVAPGAESLAGVGLAALDPERYGSLTHPGDGFSFDIYTQVARTLRQSPAAMGGLSADVLVAAGQSQSALALTTYYNGVQPLTGEFDGFFIHSRASIALPLVGPGEIADLASSFATPTAFLRTDLAAPALVLQAEGDVVGILNSAAARQPDSDSIRLWEVAGGAHADVFLIGFIADSIDCGVPINDGPMHVVAKAALRSLVTWVRSGDAPPSVDVLELADGSTDVLVRDADGIAVGGIRTAPVDVPAVVLSGEPGPNEDLICVLLGSTTALSPDRLAELHGSAEQYLAAYGTSVDESIAAGFVLAEDRDALVAYARPGAFGN